MSRAFVKEDDQEENPIIPQRAPLPEGATNYVTTAGLRALEKEKQSLEKERKDIPSEESPERRSALKVVNGKMNMLLERINSAEVIEPSKNDITEIRFGARVTFRFSSENKIFKFQIVGVDEANVKDGKIAFTSPIAKALLGKKAGEKATLILENGSKEISILEFNYDV